MKLKAQMQQKTQTNTTKDENKKWAIFTYHSWLTNELRFCSHMLLALMIPLPLLSSVQPESSARCAGLSVNNMDPYRAGQGAIRKILHEELETHSHNNEICDSETDSSDNEYVWSEHCDQEECDHVSTHETDCDGDNVTAASDDGDTDSKMEGGIRKQKMDKSGIHCPLLWVTVGKTR